MNRLFAVCFSTMPLIASWVWMVPKSGPQEKTALGPQAKETQLVMATGHRKMPKLSSSKRKESTKKGPLIPQMKRNAPPSPSKEYSEADLLRLQATNRCQNCCLQGANLDGFDLSDADLRGADLTGASLVNTNLHRADLSFAVLDDANLHGAFLAEATLIQTELMRANFTQATLTMADFSEANLKESRFVGAKLDQVHLAESVVDNTDFQGADLRHALFTDTDIAISNFSLADLTGAADIEWEQFNPKYFCGTKLPNGTTNICH